METLLEIFPEMVVVIAVFAALGVAAFPKLRKLNDNASSLTIRLVVTASFAWFYVRHFDRLAGESGETALFSLLIGLLMAATMFFMWGPALLNLVTGPIMQLFTGGFFENKDVAYYGLARGLRKKGEFEKSVTSIQEQLQKFPGDSEGLRLMADIQGEDMGDIAAAEETIETLLESEDAKDEHIAAALKRLADWRLRLEFAPTKAKETLRQLIKMFPESEFETEAKHLINRIPTEENLKKNPNLREALKPGAANQAMKVSISDAKKPTAIKVTAKDKTTSSEKG